MDPKLIRAAKDIPARLKEVMNHMFEQSEPALRSGVSALRQSLGKLEQYLADVEREHLGSGSRPAPTPSAPRAAASSGTSAPATRKKRGRRRRGGKRFGIAEFLVAEMQKHPKGLRPFELAASLAADTGRDKKSSVANVNTALSRMRKLGKITNRNGVYFATPSAGSSASSSTVAPSYKPGDTTGTIADLLAQQQQRKAGRPKGRKKSAGK